MTAHASIERDKAAYLVGPGHRPAEVAQRIIEIAANREEAACTGQRGAELARSKYTPEVIGPKLSGWLESLIRSK